VFSAASIKSLISGAIAKAKSRWRALWRLSGHGIGTGRDDRKSIIAIQWLVAIATSYLVFSAQDSQAIEPLPGLLIFLCLLSAVVVQRIPDDYFDRHVVEPGLLVVDSILIVSAITLCQQTPWDLLLLFSFCVFIAATGENLIHTGTGCTLLSLAFLVFVSPYAQEMSSIRASFLIRVPFMFGISIVYGHLASQIKREKTRIEKMEETMRLRRQLVCALAHDIKTPLNVILGHAELLAEESGSAMSPAEKRFSIKCIRNNINGIVKLITEFLDVSKLGATTLNSAKSPVQMNDIIENIALQQSVTTREKNLRLSLELDQDLKPVFGDHDQLERALWNLVSNAIKFTPSGGRITVSTRMIKKNISINVTDTGAGIPKEELSALFTEYRRLEGTANIEGTGLGLFIVKTIVEAHNGSVAVESEEGVGTTFTVLLPSSRISATTIASHDAAERPGAESQHHQTLRPAVDERAEIQ
jgi:signal transduction histidine kinase